VSVIEASKNRLDDLRGSVTGIQNITIGLMPVYWTMLYKNLIILQKRTFGNTINLPQKCLRKGHVESSFPESLSGDKYNLSCIMLSNLQPKNLLIKRGFSAPTNKINRIELDAQFEDLY
jgi:hypothetical protein